MRRRGAACAVVVPCRSAPLQRTARTRACARAHARTSLYSSAHWLLTYRTKTLRLALLDKRREVDRTEDNLKALQSVGQTIGEVLKQVDDGEPSSTSELTPRLEQLAASCG